MAAGAWDTRETGRVKAEAADVCNTREKGEGGGGC